MSKQLVHLPDCTNRCHSIHHGDILTAATTKRSISHTDLSSFFLYTCCCCESVMDSEGRNALHIAASCGRTDLVRWLVENRRANVNVKDRESGYTALHRSMFHGKIDTAVELIKLGASLTVQDSDSLTYLEHAMVDRFRPKQISDCGEAFTWGANSNNSLGSQLPRTVPETMDIFHKEYPNEFVRQLLIQEYHSVILTQSGSVFSCGHGQGGRLGLGIQHTEVIPKLIKFPNVPNTNEKVEIINFSISRDHGLFLSSSGEIYSCGLNKHRVLGIAPPPTELLVPKIVKHFADKNSFVATGNYHSMVWNKSGMFTWGLNAGQLGHQLINQSDDKYILTPKRVKCISTTEDNYIKLACSGTGASVVYTKKGDVFVLHEYQCRKIASRLLNLVQLAVIGGKLNHTLDSELSSKNRELKVVALTNTGNVLLWQESDPVLRRCVFSINRSLNIKQVTLNINHLMFVTLDGEAFRGEAKPRKKKTVPVEKDTSIKSDFHKFLEKDECISVKLERIPRVHRGIFVQSDPKGQNFAVIQELPYKEFKLDEISESTMRDNMLNLHLTAESSDDITDIEFNVGGKTFAAHRYILASKSKYFFNLFSQHPDQIIPLKGYHPNIFEELLMYIYTGNSKLIELGELRSESLLRLCHFTKPIEEVKENLIIDGSKSAFKYYSKKEQNGGKEKKLDNPVRMLHEMSKRFEVDELQKILSNLDMSKNCIILKKGAEEKPKVPLKFDRNMCPELYDIEIECKDERVVKAHKCILAARLDYFASLFSSRWKGGETSRISMPFSKGVVEGLLEFLYTDTLDKLNEKDTDQLFKIIILADQFFVTRLKDQCENILSNLLTIKNAIQLLTFADAYHADSLKETCFDFIQKNMTSFLELKLLEDLECELLKELSQVYQVKRAVDYRTITPYSTAVSDESILKIGANYPVDITEIKEKVSKVSSARKRVRNHKNSTSEKHLSQSLESDSSINNMSFRYVTDSEESLNNSLPSRLRAIVIASDIARTEEIDENFTRLKKKSESDGLSRSFVEFPLLSSPPQHSGFHGRTPKSEGRLKPMKLSQKQRKRLSSESGQVGVEVSPNIPESPKNPWKILQDPVSPQNSPKNDSIGSIISSEKRQKENLVKITSKQLIHTQLEDKAIEELRVFYNVDNIEEEVIIIDRVSMGAIAVPTWVPKVK
ncbi:inhibitor of Bruton tyrosine kinase [Anthonomus grandis grandis]|uniref:inhibitor of Bruton tyrosine kinase n=1 Tax=Anthonomus grandis grandis TaxID=2921223 RepID=UPI002166B0E4|nr:inhibitor of Bruton tyrosine kinase [Anthonomus grandis grandis]